MDDASNIPRIATLLADPARAAMLWTLIDGTSRPAGELAFAANVSAQSASAHLAKLVAGGLLLSQAQGRHRYFTLASAEAAYLVESLASFGSAPSPRVPRPAPLVKTMPGHFLHARTCYDHLAGEIAVKVLDAMLNQKWLTRSGPEFHTTALGREKLAAWGISPDHTHSTRRAFARSCIDLTQRRPHLAGRLGAALLNYFVAQGWILRNARSRVVTITPKGHAAYKRELGVAL